MMPATTKFYFIITGDPADSPQAPSVDVYRKDACTEDHDLVVDLVGEMADLWTERAHEGCENALDVASVRASFVADALKALSLFAGDCDRARVFAAETTDDSCWRTKVRIYCEEAV